MEQLELDRGRQNDHALYQLRLCHGGCRYVGHERTLPTRLSDVRNVKDFGATGDGVTDDRDAIDAAFNSDTVFRTTSSSNRTATFTGVVSTAKFTGTISGNNLTTSGTTGTIAIGQTISGSGVTDARLQAAAAAPPGLLMALRQAVGPVAMQTDSILVASGVSGTVAVNNYLLNNGGTVASPSTIHPTTYVTANKGGGVYSLRLFTPADAGFQEILQQNFTSQAMMTVGNTLSLTSSIVIVPNQGVYDVNNAAAFGDGFSVNGTASDSLSTGTTVVIISGVLGLVGSGDSIGFQFPEKGIIYFPPGNYYVSQPIDFTAGSPPCCLERIRSHADWKLQ